MFVPKYVPCVYNQLLMINHFYKLIFFLVLIFSSTFSFAEKIKRFDISGNERISDETIKMFSSVSINDDLTNNNINDILIKLYDTNYFENINLNFTDGILYINIQENPIIQSVIFNGIKTNKILNQLKTNISLKERTSFNKILINNEKNKLYSLLKNNGYYSSKIDILHEKLDDNLINIIFNIELGEKAKVIKISFIGNKVFKDSKLKRIITSEEYKFWKIISGRKFLNENLINLDKRLLKNFYLNRGYYNAVINSSFAKKINDEDFEIIFNIDAKEKIYFGNLELDLPIDFDKDNFSKIEDLFQDIEDKQYSIYLIDKILKKIDEITILEQYKFINATVVENIIDNKINLTFKVGETEKIYVKKINIYGNNVTQENVIRNQLEISEGDPFNEILFNKSINNLKSLGFFKNVNQEILTSNNDNSKIINISVKEKPTGEIVASAGVGTSGATIGFGIKENNFLGAGINLDTNISVSTNAVKGQFKVINPNYKNSDKSVRFSIDAVESDSYDVFGYKSNKTGFSLGTNFEYLDDLILGIGTSNFYEKIETNSTASTNQKKQEGDYWDTFLDLDFKLDKRNQKFQTSSGFVSFYSTNIPIISDTQTFKNYYNYKHYFDLFENNISSASISLEAANSLSNKNVKLSERVKIPSSKLRGFESGSIGPKDGKDFVGGNYGYVLNFSSTLPQILEDSQNVDFLIFFDAANVWGVDYQSSLDINSTIRSSAGIALDWFSPLGPMNFSLALPLTKADSDKTETFKFNLGTTF